jgi:glycerophosphoryl diester phosphodiesterase
MNTSQQTIQSTSLNPCPLTRRKFDSINRLKNKQLPFIEGHRGMNRIKPQNTIISFKEAINHNLDSIELDIWLTKDLIPLVIHGGQVGELEECTNGKGRVKDQTLSEILPVRTTDQDQPIPTLEEVLLLCKDKLFINIEIKDDRIETAFNKVIEVVEKHEMLNQIAISSFKHEYYDHIQRYNKSKGVQIEFGFLYERVGQPKFREYNYDVQDATLNIPQIDINADIVKKIREKHNGVFAWFTMTDEENENRYKYLLDIGVDVICCNYPDKAKVFRDKYYMTK